MFKGYLEEELGCDKAYTGPEAMCSVELSLEIRAFIRRREMALLIIEAMEDGIRMKRRIADELVEEQVAVGILYIKYS